MTTLNYKNRTPALAELKVSYRRNPRKPAQPDTKVVQNADAAIAFFRDIWDDGTIDLREEFVLLCLTLDCQVLGWVRLSTGNREATALDPRMVLAIALKTASAAIVVAHNHPVGPCRPSQPDIAITRRLEEAANLLGIMLLEGEDMTVNEGRLMVRTVSGLKPISVLWRRLDAAFADPLELRADSHIGTPGLAAICGGPSSNGSDMRRTPARVHTDAPGRRVPMNDANDVG